MNDEIEFLKVHASPMVSSDEENSDSDDHNHGNEQGDELIVREKIGEVQS